MAREEQDDKTIYKVVINLEEQYSIWPADRENPAGWRDGGKTGLKPECLARIKEVWTDMRPLSLRQQMEEMAQRPPAPEPAAEPTPPGESLVQRLARGQHPVLASRAKNPTELKESCDRGYVLVKFTDTQGGTELGLRLDPQRTVLDQADFTQGQGVVRLVAPLTLDYVKVRCVAEIDLATLSGQGHLELLEAEA